MKKWLALLLAGIMCAAMAAPAFADSEVAFAQDIIKSVSSVHHQAPDAKNSYEPAMGFDGNIKTRVSIDIKSNDGEYIIVELKDKYVISGLNICWNNGEKRFYDVEISTSLDGQTWTVASKRGGTVVAAAKQGYSPLVFSAPVEAQYIKLHCWGKTDTADNIFDGGPKEDGTLQSWLTFWEMEINTVDYADAKIASAYSDAYQAGYPALMGLDGNIATRFSMDITSEAGEYMIVALDRKMFVNGLDISWNQGEKRFYDVEVSVSNDAKNWVVAAPRQNTAVAKETKGFSALPFTDYFEAKYIKVHCWGKVDTADGVYDGAPKNGKVQSWLTFWEMKVNAVDELIIPGTAAIASMSSLDCQAPDAKNSYEAAMGADGDLNTRVSIEIDTNDGEYLIAELDKAYTVTGLDISWNNGEKRFYDIEVSVSMDGENWTVADARRGTAVASGSKAFSAHVFPAPVEAKYVKIHCWGKTDLADGVFDGGPKDGKVQSWLTFWEMKVNTQTVLTVSPDEEALSEAVHSCEEEWAPVTEWVEVAPWVEEEAWVSESEWAEDDCWHIEEDNWF